MMRGDKGLKMSGLEDEQSNESKEIQSRFTRMVYYTGWRKLQPNAAISPVTRGAGVVHGV